MKHKLPFYFFCLFTLISNSYGWEGNDDPYNVTHFNTNFTKINIDMGDVLDYMDIVAGGTGLYLGPAGGVLQLMVQITQTIFKPDSDELKAIKKVQQTLNIAQHRVLKSVDTLRATTQILQQSSAYSDAVAIPLGVFDDKISILLQNEVNLVETFRHICNPLNSRSPIYTLQFFKKRFMDDCQGLNSPEAIEETAQIYVEVLKYFHHFEKHFNSTKAFNRQEQDRYSRVKSDTMSSVAKMSKENATLYLKSFKKATKTRDFKTKGHSHRINVLEAIIPEAPGNTCYMYNAVLGYAYSHQPVLAELKSMTYDLVDTHFTASFCASFLNDGNPELIKANLEQIQNHTYRILKFSKNFTLNVLDSAWNKNLFQETITDTLIDYDFVDQNYQAATVKTEKALNLIGNPQWSYQVMIYKADPYGWAMRCKNIWLCFKVEINQFASAYVFRHPKGSTDRAQSAGEWLNDDKKTKLCKAIKNQVGEEPQTIINAMEKYLEEDVTNRYHGFSLIQERYPDPKQAEINAQVSPDRGKRNKKFQSKDVKLKVVAAASTPAPSAMVQPSINFKELLLQESTKGGRRSFGRVSKHVEKWIKRR